MKKYDLIVAGGGLSGVCAAVSAAREGLGVLLIEKSGSLGGAISNNLVYPFMAYWTNTLEGEREYLSEGLFREIREREKKYVTAYSDMDFRPEYIKLVLDEMVCEAGVDVLFHATVFEVTVKDRHLKSVSVASVSGKMELEAELFIDATGNGDLFYLAGCDYQLGRESDGLCQPMTTCFRMSGVDIEGFKADRDRLHRLYKEKQASGEITNPREDILAFFGIGEGVVHFNTTRVVKHDPTDPFSLSRAEMTARRQVYEMANFFKQNSEAFKNSTVISVASEIGVRESRKLKGAHILTAQELKDLTDFDDSIALGNYDIDIHNPSGSGTSHYYFGRGEYYKIPYRSLLPKEFDNLLVAGRCISATHEAQASIRIMPICACLGEAAGTAVAVAFKWGKNAHTVDIRSVQARLKENGAKL